MKLLRIYQCLCDETRLRILALLIKGPLCVCHLQDILGESQVNISRHLAYLKVRGMVEAKRHQNWMIYRLPLKRSAELEANLKCLQDCLQTESIFKRDMAGLQKLLNSKGVQDVLAEACCTSARSANKIKATT